jgi:N-formylglutamate deformylase
LPQPQHDKLDSQVVYTIKKVVKMSDSYTLIKGHIPLLISMPHNGEALPQYIADKMTEQGKKVVDTDWHQDKLYAFAKAIGAYIIMPKYSRYVIDLNRDPQGVDLYPGANSTELCPTTSFDLAPLYIDGQVPDEKEIAHRITTYWQPYHQALKSTLTDIQVQFGKAVLLEAHSILSKVPRFFEGQLPDFNFGTADGTSCAPELLTALKQLDYSPYSMIDNGRFKGGFITREYGQPDKNIHSVQLELSQRTYMSEPSSEYNEALAEQVIPKLEQLVQTLVHFSQH